MTDEQEERPPRCGQQTFTGPCERPLGHAKTGHISRAIMDKKRERRKQETPPPPART